MYFTEPFSDAERAVLSRFFTNTDRPVFALINMPEVVKGALFARYSRSPKSLRRLFLDEFYDRPETGIEAIAESVAGEDNPSLRIQRAESLYERVFSEYGDDSVAQLGGAHLACEQSSNLLTKVLEWGRLAAYLEQSTRYIYYDQKDDGRYRYLTPPEIAGTTLAADYNAEMEMLFDTYSKLVRACAAHFERKYPKEPEVSGPVWRSSIRAKACDAARGLLPAATLSNVGIFATGQAYEAMLIRMQASPLEEVRQYTRMMLQELRYVIPAFLRRVDIEARGIAWSKYFSGVQSQMEDTGSRLAAQPAEVAEVSLTEWDPDAEVKLIASALYAVSGLPDDQLLALAKKMPAAEREKVLKQYVGDRKNRRHRPGRAFERVFYRFDVLSDFGSFRDLQRHRMLTLEWQRLTPDHGYNVPDAIEEIGASGEWHAALGRMAELYQKLNSAYGPDVAQYAVPFAYRLRYYMHMNAREAFHLLELRTSRQGHADYRRICQEMHRLIREKAGHRLIADAMNYVDHNEYDLERLDAERRSEERRHRGAQAQSRTS